MEFGNKEPWTDGATQYGERGGWTAEQFKEMAEQETKRLQTWTDGADTTHWEKDVVEEIPWTEEERLQELKTEMSNFDFALITNPFTIPGLIQALKNIAPDASDIEQGNDIDTIKALIKHATDIIALRRIYKNLKNITPLEHPVIGQDPNYEEELAA